MADHGPAFGVVLIGRNEGERLVRALAAAGRAGMPMVYVDSGSTDGSIAAAEAAGAQVVELDTSTSFTAARARNAGLEAITQAHPSLCYVQFIDGDCELVDGWLDAARSHLDSHPDCAAVCGRRRERFPDASLYNREIDREWDTPVGEAGACGGDAMMRVAAVQSVGAFDGSIAAGEEPELCLRLREAGHTIMRLDHEMTLHDAALTRFGQWWRRGVRSGRGALDVYLRTRGRSERLFAATVRRTAVWTLGWLVFAAALCAVGGVAAGWGGMLLGVAVALALQALQTLRMAARYRAAGESTGHAAGLAALNALGKWAALHGQGRYVLDRLTGRRTRLVEYKGDDEGGQRRQQEGIMSKGSVRA